MTTTAALQINQIFRQGSLVLVSVLLAKSGLSSHEIGIFESLLFIGTTVSFFWMNALLQGTLAQYASVTTSEKAKLKFNIFLIFNVLSLIIFLILISLKNHLVPFLVGQTNLPYFDLYCLYLLLNLPPIVLESFWAVEDTPLSILGYSIVSHLFLPLCIIIPIWLKLDLGYSILAMIALAGVRYIWLIINILQNKIFTFDKKIISSFLILSLPLMGYSFIGGFITAFSSWIVSWFYHGDLHVFAQFRYGAREFPLTLALVTGLSNSIVPILVKNKAGEINENINDFKPHTEGLEILKLKSKRLWHWLFPMSIFLMLSSKLLFPLVFNPIFKESAAIFNIYLLLLISRALFPQSILLALKETKTMLWISIVETILIVLLSFLLIFPLGTEGVVWATVLGFTFEKIALMAFLKRKYGITWAAYTDVKVFLGYCILLIIAYYLSW
jgi:peptidoglycan biosynthesis protein MviN/MurJ (putative lipid II flippase)